MKLTRLKFIFEFKNNFINYLQFNKSNIIHLKFDIQVFPEFSLLTSLPIAFQYQFIISIVDSNPPIQIYLTSKNSHLKTDFFLM